MTEETKPTELVIETIQAPYRFTNDERLKLGEDLVGSMQNLDHIERELDSVKHEFKARIEKCELEVGSFRRKLADGFEMRPTAAIVQFNVPSQGRKQYTNQETGEVIRDEFMTPADFDRPLFRDPNGADATAVVPAPEVSETTAADLVPMALDQPGWTVGGLLKEFTIQARKKGWRKDAVDEVVLAIDASSDIQKVKDALRPHVAIPSED